jgi:hypothetical protein
MLFLFMLWASHYSNYNYGTQGYGGYNAGRYTDNDDDNDDDIPSKTDTYEKSEKNYAKGETPEMLQGELSAFFSAEKVREILGVPDTTESLREWRVSNLGSHDVSGRKKEAVKSAIDNLCNDLQEKDPSFCKNYRTTIDRIATGAFHDRKSAVLGQLLQLIQLTLKEEEKKLIGLKKKTFAIQQQAPEQKRQMLEKKARVREEERKLDKDIKILEKQLNEKKYSEENDKQYDREALVDLKEQKALLLIEPEHVHRDLNKQAQTLKRITKQKHLIQSDIEKFKSMVKELSAILKRRESSADLKKAWNEINTYFKEREKNEEADTRRKEEEARKKAEEEAQEKTKEQQKEAKEIEMLKGLEGEVSDPETTAAAKKTGGLFSELFKGISDGG